MNEEKLYFDVDYPSCWKEYRFYLKNHTNFVAFCECEHDIDDKWRLVEMCGRKIYEPYPEIEIKSKDINYFVDVGYVELWSQPIGGHDETSY